MIRSAATLTEVGIVAAPVAVVFALAATVAADPPVGPMPPSGAHRSDRAPASPPKPKAVRAGQGLVIAGGVTMAVGAGVLLPIAMKILLKTPAPDPDDYTAIAPFERDVAIYRATIDRGTDIGVAGAIVGGVGAAAFTIGALTWGIGGFAAKRAQRRAAARTHVAAGGSRRGASVSLSVRF